ncbi:MAG: hypothetical protein KDB47_06280 [Mycobacterium sp.]|nr:hypothetical protein [Mycobacterium sp.]
MSTTAPTTWQDLAGQLTAEQRERLAANAGHLTEAELLAMARHWADYAQLQADLAAVPAPAGATRCSSWFRDGDEGPTRAAYGRCWVTGGGSVQLSCDQRADGSTAPWRVEVAVDQGLADLGQVQTRELAEALTAAADELDRLSGNPYPVDSTYHRCCGGIGRHVNCGRSSS